MHKPLHLLYYGIETIHMGRKMANKRISIRTSVSCWDHMCEITDNRRVPFWVGVVKAFYVYREGLKAEGLWPPEDLGHKWRKEPLAKSLVIRMELKDYVEVLKSRLPVNRCLNDAMHYYINTLKEAGAWPPPYKDPEWDEMDRNYANYGRPDAPLRLPRSGYGPRKP